MEKLEAALLAEREKVRRLREVIDPFYRATKMQKPLRARIDSKSGVRSVWPGAWPTMEDAWKLMDLIDALAEAGEEGK